MTEKTSAAREFADSTTLHGIPDAVYSRNAVERVAWILLIVGCLGYLAMEVRNILLEYQTEPTSTQFGLITPTSFPEILYCPAAWVDPKKIAALGWKSSRVWFLISHLLAVRYSILDRTQRAAPIASSEDAYFEELGWSMDNVFRNISYTAEEMLKSIEWTTSAFQPLGYNATLFMTHRGMCLKIVTGGRGFYDLEAATTSLRFEVRSFPRSYTDRSWDLIYFGKRGLSVVPAGDVPVNREQKTTILLQTTLMENANLRRRPCLAEQEVAGDSTKLDMFTCALSLAVDYCTAADKRAFYIPQQGQMPAEISGFGHISESCLLAENIQERIQKLKDECLAPCVKWIYESSLFPHKGTYSSASVEVSYMNPLSSLWVVETKSFSLASLVGSVGGTISLWSGASILTAAQIILFVVRLALKRKGKGSVASDEKKPEAPVRSIVVISSEK